MAGFYTFGLIIATILGIIVAAYVFADIVYPAAIYIVQYIRYGKDRAEADALDSMGENKMSYVVKDGLKNTKIIDDPAVNNLQEGLGNAVGGLVDKGGIGGGLAKGISDIGSDSATRSQEEKAAIEKSPGNILPSL
ncbi:MAG: hypothetical protein M4579_002108 [Chaenotheca gracillima]|nr:MAG: hypothetical protein M4579_002108 [Chaenotheca gracillima]